jgi:hypothetical protein
MKFLAFQTHPRSKQRMTASSPASSFHHDDSVSSCDPGQHCIPGFAGQLGLDALQARRPRACEAEQDSTFLICSL